jgi:hypothetical protein
MNKLLLALTLFASLSFASIAPTPAQAKQYRLPDGRIAHTRAAPVVIHRVFPPFKGQHVYRR